MGKKCFYLYWVFVTINNIVKNKDRNLYNSSNVTLENNSNHNNKKNKKRVGKRREKKNKTKRQGRKSTWAALPVECNGGEQYLREFELVKIGIKTPWWNAIGEKYCNLNLCLLCKILHKKVCFMAPTKDGRTQRC